MERKPLIGKYILDTLSIGMYNHPLMIIREYIQNSVDAIDTLAERDHADRKQGKVDIRIDWRTKSLTITDNGCGIPSDLAFSALNDLGKSLKKSHLNRGFRGIGRLGGLGYCEHISFKTKARNDKKVSISTWDCNKLRGLLNNEGSLDIFDALKEVTSFTQEAYVGDKQANFFTVEMIDVKGSRDILLNVPEIKKYISQVAPVPFDHINFSFSTSIETELRSLIPKYETYNIYVNGEKLYKPYRDDFTISDKHKDKIRAIHFIKLESDEDSLAFAWIAETKLLGIIRSSTLFDGLRVRTGNIMVGDKYLLADFYRERRFNNYLAGEVHTIDNRLIPNSRRDDFEDNAIREDFYSYFIKEIGLPSSSAIRKESTSRAVERKGENYSLLINRASKIQKRGFFSEKQRDNILSELNALQKTNSNKSDSILDDLISKLENTMHYIMVLNGDIPRKRKKLLVTVISKIYDLCSNKAEAEKIITSIVESISRE